MNWELIGLTLGILLGLAIFGTSYHFFVARQDESGRAEGFTSLFVAGGSLVTLFGVGLLDLLWPEINAGLLGLAAFTCSGLPMMVGSLTRYARMRETARKAIRDVGRG